jgi:glycosyltransferase involved in cell wall biosynthesis
MQSPSEPSTSPLLVFSDDWGRHPSSCQHLIRHLLDRHPVTWVNTIGTRKPRLDLATIRRALGKLAQWVRPARGGSAGPANPRVLNPRMWPGFDSRFSRALNRRLLARALLPILRELSAPAVAVTTIPLVADLVGVLPVRRWVYYCVDDFSVWPGYDGALLARMEQDLVARVDDVIAVSETLSDRLHGLGREAHLLTHGIELDFWTPRPDAPRCPSLDAFPRPLVLFWGLIDRRMDLAFVRALARKMTAGTLVLLGPKADPDPELATIPRVVRPGAVPFEQLPGAAQQASVLVMPYADLPVTRAMQPLKLKEYLATGLPVVARDLPATRIWADCLDLASSPEQFADLVLRRIAEGIPHEQRQARSRLVEESWAGKARCFADWLEGRS